MALSFKCCQLVQRVGNVCLMEGSFAILDVLSRAVAGTEF